ncbi:hypothetical protein LguiA_005109 [Lonicera macranthoides]
MYIWENGTFIVQRKWGIFVIRFDAWMKSGWNQSHKQRDSNPRSTRNSDNESQYPKATIGGIRVSLSYAPINAEEVPALTVSAGYITNTIPLNSHLNRSFSQQPPAQQTLALRFQSRSLSIALSLHNSLNRGFEDFSYLPGDNNKNKRENIIRQRRPPANISFPLRDISSGLTLEGGTPGAKVRSETLAEINVITDASGEGLKIRRYQRE